MRARDAFAGLVALAIVAVGLAYGVNWLRGVVGGPEEVTADPVTTAAAYLAAWEGGDHAAMAELVRTPPEEFAARHVQLVEGLDAQRLDLFASAPITEVDGRVRIPVEVRVTVAWYDEPLRWDVDLTVIRERGEWGVDWSLATIHPELRAGWRFDIESEPVERASILAAGGEQLAGGGTRIRLGFEPSTVTDPDAMVAAFEEAVAGTGVTAAREIGRDNLVDGWFYPVVTLSEEAGQRAWSRLRGVAGVLRQTVDERTLLSDGFAQHVVGVIDEATAEQLDELRAAGEDAEPGMRIPQFGLERALDDALTGSDRVRAGLRDGEDGPLRVVFAEVQQDPSGPVNTTIDVDVQRAVEDALAGVDGAAAMVVVDLDDGAIRAAASRPLSGYNRAFAGRYPPGSTFKIVTMEALLADGATPDVQVACPAVTTVGGLRVPNAGEFDLGQISLGEAFAASCNTTFAQLGATLGAQQLTAAAERFGFNTTPDLPLSAFGGSFPAPADSAEAGAAAFGQGRVEASVLHMATVAAAAHTGRWHAPYLLADDRPETSTGLTAGAGDVLRALMRQVVTDGTGTAAAVADLQVRGKTGTAQAGADVSHAWFVGTWDGYGFAVLVEDGGAGGAVAAPIAARFVERLAALRGILDGPAEAVEEEPGEVDDGTEDPPVSEQDDPEPPDEET